MHLLGNPDLFRVEKVPTLYTQTEHKHTNRHKRGQTDTRTHNTHTHTRNTHTHNTHTHTHFGSFPPPSPFSTISPSAQEASASVVLRSAHGKRPPADRPGAVAADGAAGAEQIHGVVDRLPGQQGQI